MRRNPSSDVLVYIQYESNKVPQKSLAWGPSPDTERMEATVVAEVEAGMEQ